MSDFRFKSSNQTIRLLNVGRVPAIPAAQLKAGMKQVFNYYDIATVLKVIEKTPKTISVIYCTADRHTNENIYYITNIRKTKLVAVSDQIYDVSSYRPKTAINYCGRNHGETSIDVSQYFKDEPSETAQNSSEQTETETESNNGSVEEKEHTEVSMTLNEKMNGIELSFISKPSEQVREQMKAHGFRWSRAKKIWYARQSEDRLQFAKSLTNGNKKSDVAEYPEIDINDLDSYKISDSLIKQENESHWLFRKNEKDWNKELQELFSDTQNDVIKILNKVQDKSIRYHLKKSLQSFKKNYYKTFEKLISYRAANPSWAVTGRAGRNRRKDRQVLDREDHLLHKLKEIGDKMEDTIDSAKYQLEQVERKEAFNDINKTQVNVQFTVSKKSLKDYPVPTRIYMHDQYWIAKAWGAWRVYRNGKEINPRVSYDTLTYAKKVVQYYINNEKQMNKAI